MLIWCSTRRRKSLREILQINNQDLTVLYIPFPASIPIFLVQRFSDSRLRLNGYRYSNPVLIKCILKDLWIDLRFNSPYFFILFHLFLVKIKPEESDTKSYLGRIPSKNFNQIILSRSAICSVLSEKISISNHQINKIENEGVKISSEALSKLAVEQIWVWRFGSNLFGMKPIDINLYLSENTEVRSLTPINDSEKIIQVVELENAACVRGLYIEKSNKIIPTSLYFMTEISKELPSLGPFLDHATEIRVANPKQATYFDSGVFAGFHPNYYHFTWEIFPKLLFFYENESVRGVPTLLNKRTPKPIIEMVKSVSGINPVLIGDDQLVKLKKLYALCDLRYRTPVDVEEKSRINIFSNRIQDLNKIRAFFKNTGTEYFTDVSKKIFVGRPRYDSRVPSNLDEIRELLILKGFHEIHPEVMSLSDQVLAFREAEEICILAGAAATSLLHCQKLKKLVVIVVDFASTSGMRFWQDYCLFLGIQAEFVYSENSKRRYGRIDITKLHQFLD